MALFSSPEKEGAGVSKNAPQVRNYISFFGTLKQYFGVLFFPNLLTSLLNLFIIPSGIGTVGSARIARIAARGRHAFSTDYFDAIKENWGKALISGIINNVIFIGALFSIYNMYASKNIQILPMAISIAALILITFIKYYTSAIMLTFNVTIFELYKNAIILSFLGIGRNLLILFLHLLSYAVILLPLFIDLYIGAGIAICLYIVFIPTFRSYSTQYHIYPVMYKFMIEPFMKSNPGKGERTLRELGLIEDEAEQIMEDTI